MQVFLFQEREQVLKLYAENDRLKVNLLLSIRMNIFYFQSFRFKNYKIVKK
jgi:hypothetical protein